MWQYITNKYIHNYTYIYIKNYYINYTQYIHKTSAHYNTTPIQYSILNTHAKPIAIYKQSVKYTKHLHTKNTCTPI